MKNCQIPVAPWRRRLAGMLRGWRIASGRAQTELAAACGLLQGALTQYELGHREPDILTLIVLSSELDRDLGELLQALEDPLAQSSRLARDCARLGAPPAGRIALAWAAHYYAHSSHAGDDNTSSMHVDRPRRLRVAIGDSIRVWRERRGYSQRLLAEAVFTTQAALAQWELGARRSPLTAVFAIAAELDVAAGELIHAVTPDLRADPRTSALADALVRHPELLERVTQAGMTFQAAHESQVKV